MRHCITGRTLMFLALLIATTVLEFHGRSVTGLWALIVFWIIFGNFRGPCRCDEDDEL